MQSDIDKLIGYYSTYGTIKTDVATLLVDYLHLILEKNEHINLTRVTDFEDGLILHIVDSLLFSLLLDEKANKMIDIGTGGGFPGIPLGLQIESDTTLLDSIQKKVKAVEDIVISLGLQEQFTCVSERVEEYSKPHSEEFDLVVSRAVGSTPLLLEYARPLLKNDGSLIISRGKSEEDQNAIDETCKILGYQMVSRETYLLPLDKGTRVLCRYVVTGDASVKLPRRVGIAVKRPLV